MNNKSSIYPCPVCHLPMFITGINNKGKKIGSCGHVWSFKKTRASKSLDKKYVSTPNGLELRK